MRIPLQAARQVTLSVWVALIITFGTEGFAQSGQTLSPGSWDNRATVQTLYGLLKGTSGDGPAWCWKGIPYARPPLGELRWKAPVDPLPWSGTREALKYPSIAAQVLPVLGPSGSEDCLYLNVWRPKTADTGLPVYLFIHGGGNSIGSGSSRDYRGQEFATRSNVVYVTVNFRLGVMGWFRHPAVTGSGSPADRSGNFGTLDLIKALEWIHENITAFGGDPGNVTIAGESGGAMDVLSLLISPPAAGLFHRAVVESGLTLVHGTADAEAQSVKLLSNLLIADRKASNPAEAMQVLAGMSAPAIDEYLRTKPVGEIQKSIPSIVGGMADWYSILTDGFVIPEEGYGVFETGTWANKVPLIIGVNKDEMKLFRFLQRDPKPGTPKYEWLSRYQSLLWRVSGLDRVAVPMTAHAGMPPVFAYRFDWGSTGPDGKSVLPGKMGKVLGANHYAEIPFFLGTGKNQLSVLTGSTYTRKNRPGRDKLRMLCGSYLANFARSGDPNGEGLPRWDPWNPLPGADKLIILDAGFQDLRISRSGETVTLEGVRQLIRTELQEPMRTEILNILNSPKPFGLGR
jgi:para-nitrobenzyl esterase